MAEVAKQFRITEDTDGNLTTEYLEYDDAGKQSRNESAPFTLAEGESLEDWFTYAADATEDDQADAAGVE